MQNIKDEKSKIKIYNPITQKIKAILFSELGLFPVIFLVVVGFFIFFSTEEDNFFQAFLGLFFIFVPISIMLLKKIFR